MDKPLSNNLSDTLSEDLLVYKALSDPLRIRLLQEIFNKKLICVCKLIENVCASQSKLSYHLKILLDAKLIRVHPKGKWNFYSIRAEKFNKLLSMDAREHIFVPQSDDKQKEQLI